MIAAETREPLPYAWLRVSGGAAALSGADGTFRISAVSAGPCTVTVSLVGYRPLRRIVSLPPDGSGAGPMEFVMEPVAIPLGEIRVNAAPTPRGVRTLTREQLAAVPGTGDDIMRAVQVLPGVAAPELSASFLLRGGESDETLVRYDGIDLLEAYHVREWGGSFAIVSLESAERIRLLKGALPARYGRHLSGVLEVDPPSPADSAARIDLGFGFTQARASGLVPSGSGSVLVAGREGVVAPVTRSIRFDPDANVVPEFHDVLAHGRWPLGGGRRLHLVLLGVADDIRLEEEFPGADVSSRVRNATIGARWSDQRRSGAHHDLVVSADAFERRTRLGRTGSDDAKTLAVRGRWESRWPVGSRMSIETGLLGEYEESRFRFDDIQGSIRLGQYRESIESTFRGPGVRRRVEWHGAWDSRWSARLSTSVGLNLSHDGYGWGARRDGVLPDIAEPAVRWSPRASVSALLSSALSVHAAAGHYTQPAFLNLMSGERARAPLGRERSSREVALGLEGALNGVVARGDVYLRSDRGANFPVQDQTRRPPLESPLDRGDSRGIEIIVTTPAWRRADASVSYAWTRATWRTAGGDVPRSFDQPHAVTLVLNVRPVGRWNANATLRYHTGNSFTRAEWVSPDGRYSWDLTYGPTMGARFPDYLRLDLRVSRPLRWGRRASFYVEMMNVTGRENPYARSWTFEPLEGGGSAPRYFFIDLIPRLPFAGLEVQF